MNLNTHLKTLANNAKTLGLDDETYKHSFDYIENHEFGLAFDTIITQLYEFNVVISAEFYSDAVLIAHELLVPETEIVHLKELF